MARVGRTWIVMHGRLSRGKCALHRELAYILVGPGVWLDIESDRAGYMGCVCTLEEFLIFQRCWFGMSSNMWWFTSLRDFVSSNRDWVNIDSTWVGDLGLVTLWNF